MSTSTIATSRGPVSEPSRPMRLLIAFDESEPARWALELGSKLAQALSARLLLVHVVVPAVAVPGEPEFYATLQQIDAENRKAAEQFVDRTRQSLPAGIECEVQVGEGLAADEILAAAGTWRADAIVMGTHARRSVARFFLGSTAETVLRRASCAVMTVSRRSAWAAPQQRAGEDAAAPAVAR